jgi:hypothetical protein
MVKHLKSLVLAACASSFIGCAVDGVQVISHPDQVTPGGQFEASLASFVMLMSNGSTMLMGVERDSIHVALGLPAGWSVVSAGYYAALDLHLAQAMNDIQDTAAVQDSMIALLIDSLPVYATRQTPLTPDQGMAAYFTGRTRDAAGPDSSATITVDLDAVDQWLTYSGPLGISYPTGTEMDAVFPLDSSINLGVLTIDSLGIAIVPVFLFLEIAAGTDPGIDTLYYFAKSAAMPDPAAPDSGQIDLGSLVYYPIDVSTSGISRSALNRVSDGMLGIDAKPGAVEITVATGRDGAARADIYTLHGELVRRFTGHGEAVRFVWEGADSRGRHRPSGTYVLKTQSAKGGVSRSFQLLSR